MLFIFVTFQELEIMADVMGMSHGGDGAGDQPPGGGDFNLHGTHQQDRKSY